MASRAQLATLQELVACFEVGHEPRRTVATGSGPAEWDSIA